MTVSKPFLYMVEIATADPNIFDQHFISANNWVQLTRKVEALGYADNWRAWRYAGSHGKITMPKVGD